MNEKLIALAAALLKRTLDGRALWQQTDRPQRFVLPLDAGTVVIDNPDESVFTLAVENDSSVVIESMRLDFGNIFESKTETHVNVRELHRLARRQVYRIDATLDSLLGEVTD